MPSIYSWITIIFWIAAFSWLATGVRSAGANVEVNDQSPFFARAFKIVAMLCMFVVIYFPRWFHLRRSPPHPSLAAGVGGVAICACGLLLIGCLRRALGKDWSDLVVVRKDHVAGAEGPYKWIRHPMYAGLVLALLGSALTVETRAAFSIAAVCFVGLFVKSRREEALLANRIAGYAEYRRRVKAFVPFVL
jgi:protein-S-isoprenylcysteine O-methyltransferase Ste14